MPNPLVNPAVLLSPVEDGYVAYDPTSDELHRLNPVAALIVELSNGQRSVDELCELAAPLIPGGAEEETRCWIGEAVEAGLLTFASAHSSDKSHRELSAEELASLASRLRDDGKVQTAYICQCRAADLAPASADVLCHLGELAHIVGRRDEARDAYSRYLELTPGDAEIRHLLTSLRDEAMPARVPNECIEQLYQRFSSFYDSSMCDELGYDGPEQLAAVIEEMLGGRRELNVLDLGCGTGLAGQRIKPRAARLCGIDLSPEMVELAKQRNIYDQLEVAEVTAWLGRATEQFDLIMACDTCIYFGDLRQVIVPALRLLTPGGMIAFSVERSEQAPFRLTDSGRYVHHLDHVQEIAAEFDLQWIHREAFLRMEYGEEVTGIYAGFARNG